MFDHWFESMNAVTEERVPCLCYTRRYSHPVASSRVPVGCVRFSVCLAARGDCYVLPTNVRATRMLGWSYKAPTGTVSDFCSSKRSRCCIDSYRIRRRMYHELEDLIKFSGLHLTSLTYLRNETSTRNRLCFLAVINLLHSTTLSNKRYQIKQWHGLFPYLSVPILHSPICPNTTE